MANPYIGIAGLNFFTKNSYSIQLVFYFLYVNMIISFSFLLSNVFRNVKTATGLLADSFLVSGCWTGVQIPNKLKCTLFLDFAFLMFCLVVSDRKD